MFPRLAKTLRAIHLVAFGFAVITTQHVVADSADDWAKMKPIIPKGYVCLRADISPRIDGRLDDPMWQAVPWSDDFLDIEGDRHPRPRLKTRVKMAWDDDYFYIGAEIDEPHVWGTLTRHDSVIFHDNDFELFIDPDGDNHEYYEFEINSLNTGWDLFLARPYKDSGTAENRWQINGLKSAVHVDGSLNDPSDEDQGWSVEIALPWSAVKEYAHRSVPPRDTDQWRVNFSRVEWQHQVNGGRYEKVPNTKEDNWVWSPQGIIDMHRPERWGYVQFSTKPARESSLRADPELPVRDLLMEIYHRQKAWFEKHQKWADSLELLELDPTLLKAASRKPELKLTETGFRALVELTNPAGEKQLWSVREDSRLRPAGPNDDVSEQIEAVLAQQAAAWNRGDVEAFMDHYWKSDDLAFSSGGRITRGWAATKASYLKRYPTQERMGQLTFGAVEVTRLSDEAAMVLGRWNLNRAPSPIGGNFTLVFRRFDGNWVITHDHTSLEPEPDTAQPPKAN